MIHSADALVADLSVFTDLGTEPPRAVISDGSIVIRLARNGLETTLTFAPGGRVTERTEEGVQNHISLRALLASKTFANMGRWADSQSILLREKVRNETIPIIGSIAGAETEGNIEFLDNQLEIFWQSKPQPRSLVVLIDGPAGIGKTSLIRSLAFRRAEQYRLMQRPLVLHVESRGRVLQNITDLMAFSLQTLRLAVTYDQIPVLVKLGLIVLAVDGFDELGDPSGYDLAWAQVNELVTLSRGQGTLLFAGRDTFISKDRMESALTALDTSIDRLEGINLKGLDPRTARSWLSDQGWTAEDLDSEPARPLFEPGSYALRPFFLSELARPGVQEQVTKGEIEDLLSFLIEAMIDRESKKFGKAIEAVTTYSDRVNFVRRFMEEVARDLAENQTGSMQVETLSWLAEVVSDDLIPNGLSGILKNRSGVIAFLADDDRRGYKKFSHDYIYNYFLARVTISSISSGELAKYIRRNILGSDFLEAFVEACRKLTQSEVDSFVSGALGLLESAGDRDRARSNLAALVLGACCVVTPTNLPTISGVYLDEAYLTETVATIHLDQVAIGQLHARATDLRAIRFSADCMISALVADQGTLPGSSLPFPGVLSLPHRTFYAPEHIGIWLRTQSRSYLSLKQADLAQILEDFEPFNLLGRIARYKPFWLKDSDEKAARRIIDDEHWPLLKSLLEKHALITERFDVPAAGRPAPFYHIKNRLSLIDFESPTPSVGQFLADLLEKCIDMSEQNEKG